ncbi:MAG: hypothetical protein VW405_15300 [Rhodospirillaceae bacterium]
MIFMGIDPGLTGAIAWVEWNDGDKQATLLHLADWPTIETRWGNGKTRRITDFAVLKSHTTLRRIHWVHIERVSASPQMGVTSAFRFGEAYGAGLMFAAMISPSVHAVVPQVWKRAYGFPKGAGKELMREAAVEVCPNAATFVRRKKDADRAEAILIALHATSIAREYAAKHTPKLEGADAGKTNS